MELSKNTPFFNLKIDSQLDHMDGQLVGIQEPKVLTIVQLEAMSVSEEKLLMLIITAAFMLESLFQELTPRLCQDNGSSKLDHATLSIQEITCGLLDIFSTDVPKHSTLLSPSSQRSSQSGMDLEPIVTTQLRP